jgi:transketolase
VEEATGSVAMRFVIGPSPRRIDLPAGVEPGRGRILRDGGDALLVAYGPVLLHEALSASELLADEGIEVAVVAMPWLNRFDAAWLDDVLGGREPVFVLEDHSPVGGLADGLRRELPGRVVTAFGVDGWPACGTPGEALREHGLDGRSLAHRIAAQTGARDDR